MPYIHCKVSIQIKKLGFTPSKDRHLLIIIGLTYLQILLIVLRHDFKKRPELDCLLIVEPPLNHLRLLYVAIGLEDPENQVANIFDVHC